MTTPTTDIRVLDHRLNRPSERRDWMREMQEEYEREKALRALRQKVSKTVRKAGQLCRRMGYSVESSKDLNGRISSYYIRDDHDRRPLRISNHHLPDTDQRQFMRDYHGGGSPFRAQIIISYYKDEIYMVYDTAADSCELDCTDALLKKAIKVGMQCGEADDII